MIIFRIATVKNELFTSLSEMEVLLETEANLITIWNKFVLKQEEKLVYLKEYFTFNFDITYKILLLRKCSFFNLGQ